MSDSLLSEFQNAIEYKADLKTFQQMLNRICDSKLRSNKELKRFLSSAQKQGPFALYKLCNTSKPLGRILFGHGNGLTAATYQSLLHTLSYTYEVIAFDSRSHGKSAELNNSDRIDNWEQFADDQFLLAAYLSENKNFSDLPLHLVAHSINAVAATRGMNRPYAPFTSITLLDPVYVPMPISFALACVKFLGLSSHFHPLAKAAARRRTVWASYDDAKNYLIGRKALANWPQEAVEYYVYSGMIPRQDGTVVLACPAHDEAKFFATIPTRYLFKRPTSPVPTHVIRGEMGETNLARALKIQQIHGNMTITTLAKHDHFGSIVHPQETADCINHWLKTIE